MQETNIDLSAKIMKMLNKTIGELSHLGMSMRRNKAWGRKGIKEESICNLKIIKTLTICNALMLN